MSRRGYALFGIALVGLAAYFIWTDDLFQKRYFPQRYWESEVARLERTVSGYERFLAWERLELAKNKMTLEADIGQVLVTVSDPAAREVLVNSRVQEITETVDLIALTESELAKARLDLQEAKRQLALVESR